MKTHAPASATSTDRSEHAGERQNAAGPVFEGNRSSALAQLALAETAKDSARVTQQIALSNFIHGSPRMLAQREAAEAAHVPWRAPNHTGLPDQLKSGIESMSGMSMDQVKVHYNSSKPAQLNAHAYAQGSDIHLAPSQQKHLPHEAWHVVQQQQGRVKPRFQMKGSVSINDDAGLEHEADVMGGKALAVAQSLPVGTVENFGRTRSDGSEEVVQRERLEAAGPEKEVNIDANGGKTKVQSKVIHTSGVIHTGSQDGFGLSEAEVGIHMDALLFPVSPIQGSPVSGGQWKWMDALKQQSVATVIRGHLLNHDLGGKGLSYNLFPISNSANSEHSAKVEENVKDLLYGDSAKKYHPTDPVRYNVSVIPAQASIAKNAVFYCAWSRGTDVFNETIISNLGTRAYKDRNRKDVTGKTMARVSAPDGWAKGAKEQEMDLPARMINAKAVGAHDNNLMNRGVQAVVHDSTFQAIPTWINLFETQLSQVSPKYSNDKAHLVDVAKALWSSFKNTTISMDEAESICADACDKTQWPNLKEKWDIVANPFGPSQYRRVPDVEYEPGIIKAAKEILISIKNERDKL